MPTPLEEFVGHTYDSGQRSALVAQQREWLREQPLAGTRVLDCTPFFRNTLAKFVSLVSAGAHVTVGLHPQIPFDPTAVKLLPSLGLDVRDAAIDADGGFDVVLDCAGRHKNVASTRGFAELTHSGLDAYRDCEQPVVLIDKSPLKLLETMFGTGESFFRALDQLGYVRPAGPVVIFGAGKVGSGVAYAAQQRGLDVVAVDDVRTAANFAGADIIDYKDDVAVRAAIASAWVVVTATGVPEAAADYATDIVGSSAILANMGVDDEFGAEVPQSRVLNGKTPLNFILEEPTLLPYLDPVFALSNAAAVELAHGRVSPGLNAPDSAIELPIAAAMRDAKVNMSELGALARIMQ